ncbi:MAG: dihydropyrimidinase [Bacteroidota bacterium]
MQPILIRNGTIVNADKSFKSDILVIGNMIAEISDNIPTPEEAIVIDAEGKYILPGCIDPHVHMQLPTPAGDSSDTFFTGSRAALLGGTTTFIDFVTPRKEESLLDALYARRKEATTSCCDYSFHMGITSDEQCDAAIIEKLIQEEGITSFKVYLAYLNSIGIQLSTLEKLMQILAPSGATLLIHCEDGNMIDALQKDFIAQNKTTPQYHALSRPPESEYSMAVQVIDLCRKTKCNVYFVHVSCAETADLIHKAKAEGLSVFAETCPHYLLKDDSEYSKDWKQAATAVLSPPLRTKENTEKLWMHVAAGTIDTIATDHCPFFLSQKNKGKDNFTRIPNGAGSIEHRLSLMYTYGVLENKITMNKMVQLLCENPARIFYMYPVKGVIAEGADADMVIWNPDAASVIAAKTHAHCSDLELYEGIEIKGEAAIVFLKGQMC